MTDATIDVGVIGFGRFGALAVRHLAREADLRVMVHEPARDAVHAIEELGALPATLVDVCRARVVIPLVPMSAFESVIESLAPHLDPGTIVIDACSVKERPVEIMQRHLPESVSIIATHPLFGPDSAADGLDGKRLVWCPVRVDRAMSDAITSRLRAVGIDVIETTPEDHDRQIAETQVLTHLVGRTLEAAEVRDWPIDTPGYRRLQHVLGTTANDTWQLFADMNHLNRFAPAVRERLRSALDRVLRTLEAERPRVLQWSSCEPPTLDQQRDGRISLRDVSTVLLVCSLVWALAAWFGLQFTTSVLAPPFLMATLVSGILLGSLLRRPGTHARALRLPQGVVGAAGLATLVSGCWHVGFGEPHEARWALGVFGFVFWLSAIGYFSIAADQLRSQTLRRLVRYAVRSFLVCIVAVPVAFLIAMGNITSVGIRSRATESLTTVVAIGAIGAVVVAFAGVIVGGLVISLRTTPDRFARPVTRADQPDQRE